MRARPAAFVFALLASSFAAAADSTVLIMGVWPDRLRVYDDARGSFVDEIRLRHGAVTSYGETAHSADYRRLFYVTDRMEAVEIVDVERREVVDEIRLSTPGRRVRIFAVASDPAGSRLYIRARAVTLGIDRFEPAELDFVTYDVERREIVDSFDLPAGVDLGFFDSVLVSRDGRELFALGIDIVRLDAETREIRGRFPLSRQQAPGVGPIQLSGFVETAPDTIQGIYRTTDPVAMKKMTGVVSLDIATGRLEAFEIGPELDVDVFALSPDGRHAYAGFGDLVKVDLVEKRILLRKEKFERGRTNTTLVVSADGRKLFVAGVGDRIEVVDAGTLERAGSIEVGGDLMSPVVPLPPPSP